MPNKIKLELNKKEFFVVQHWRTLKFGVLTIIVRDGVPQVIKEKERHIDLNKSPVDNLGLTEVDEKF